MNTLHRCTCTRASPQLPFWYQGRNQGQGTLAVLLGIVSGQHENLSKVRLQTSSAEGQELVELWPQDLPALSPIMLGPRVGSCAPSPCQQDSVPTPRQQKPPWTPHRH